MRTLIFLSVLISGLSLSPLQAQNAETHGHIYRFTEPGTLIVEMDDGITPVAGDTGTVYKYSVNDFAGVHFTAWVSIAKVTVIGVEGRYVGLRVDEEISVVHVNGEKLEHFQEGKEVKIEWPSDSPPPDNEK